MDSEISSTTWLRALGLVAILVFLVTAFTPLPNLAAQRLAVRPQVEAADAIVVLGGRLRADGTLDASSLRRAVTGIVLQRRGLAPLLVFSGVTSASGPGEPEQRAALARALSVPAEQVLPVPGAHTTREESLQVGSLLRARGVRRILLVSDSQHLRRARPVFERAGVRVLAAPADEITADDRGPGGRLAVARWIAREALARLYYWLTGA